MPIRFGCLNPLIFKELIEGWNYHEEKIATFFVTKMNTCNNQKVTSLCPFQPDY